MAAREAGLAGKVAKAAGQRTDGSLVKAFVTWKKASMILPRVPRMTLPETNLLIKGDNRAVLDALRSTHRGKIQLVYIDPPYNTGQKFTYEDRFGDHSRWLSMMAPRLKLARDFLRDDGLLFVSIDEHEHRNLVMLGCEVFGEEHYLEHHSEHAEAARWSGILSSIR